MPPTVCPRCRRPSLEDLCRRCRDVEATELLLDRVAGDAIAAHRLRTGPDLSVVGRAVRGTW